MTVNQPNDTTGAHIGFNDEITSARVVNPLPYADDIWNGNYTQNTSDPVHSCTGSKDFRTAWWTLSAQATGQMLVSANDVYGQTGIVITVYQLTGSALGPELGCATIPPATTWALSTSIQFAVLTGVSYAIEISAPVPQVGGGGWIDLAVSVLPHISITPSSATMIRGTQQQFTAALSNTPITVVRWTIAPPLGTITPQGLYTAPATVIAPMTVAIIAGSLANPAARATAVISVTPSVITNPSAINISWQQGSPVPSATTLALSSAAGQSYTFTASPASSGWLNLNSLNGSVPGSLSISINPLNLLPGNYRGQVTLTVPGIADGPFTIPVTLAIIDNSAAPIPLSITPALGGHLKTGHSWTLQNRPTERTQYKDIYTVREVAWANIFS